MSDPNELNDPEGVARGDYFNSAATEVPPAAAPVSPPAGDPALDSGGDPASASAANVGDDPNADADANANQGEDTGGAAGPVPYGRFKEVVDQKKASQDRETAAQARIKALEAQLAAPIAAPAAPVVAPEKPDVVAGLIAERLPLYKQVEEARLDGEVDLAAELQQKIDDINQSILLEKSTAASNKTLAVDKEIQRYELFVDSVEAAHPQFRSDAPEYDPVMVRSVNETADAFEATGMTPTKALQKALALLGPKQGTTPAAAAAHAAPATPTAAKPDVAKSVAALKGQPADLSNAGVNKDEIKINVAALTDEEYDKLPESTRAKLRGDFAA